ARTQIADAIERMTDEYLVGDFVEEWDIDALLTQIEQIYPVAIAPEDLDPNALERSALIGELREDVIKAYDEREQELGPELMRQLERFILLQIIDDRWREHLHDMDYLREGIHLRGFAQEEPLVAYKNEGFGMFITLVNSIWEEFGRYIFNVEVEVEGGNGDQAQTPAQAWGTGSSSSSTANFQYQGGRPEDQPSALQAAAAGALPLTAADVAASPEANGAPEDAAAAINVETRRLDEHEQIGRNDPCWCGSGKKFKKCHGA
ncbi:MAG: preprotein translocase subunit SecA, partial [Thermoleophilaceae bacterium]|nr:preprotein translocase subunit SecA [Thermoleophilaceae bacterium]